MRSGEILVFQMPGYKIDKMGEIIFANVEELSVSDVYDLACEIGKECESLIANFGPDPVNALIKKVIISLELLEKFATRNEHESAALAEYAEQVQRLEAEKEQRTENRQKFEKDIETVEEQWRREVTRLEEENKRLVTGNRESNSRGDTSSSNCPGQLDVTAELESMQRLLRHEVENHKTELKRREDELNAQQEETENVGFVGFWWKREENVSLCLAASNAGGVFEGQQFRCQAIPA